MSTQEKLDLPGQRDGEIDVNNKSTVTNRPLVHLDRDHPGFRDPDYRERRNEIAHIAEVYRSGDAIPDAPYTKEENDLWALVMNVLGPAHAEHACKPYLESFKRIELPLTRIPQLSEVTEKVQRLSGFRLEPVAGLVERQVFLQSLSEGVFLSTQYIRHYSAPLYTPEPDVVHEVIGHAVTLASTRLAELNRLFGEVVRRAKTPEEIDRIARVYWYTIEFGVLKEDDDIKAYGAGLLSSAGEMDAMKRAEIRPLDFEAASELEFDPSGFQPVLFCAESFEKMHADLGDFLRNWL